jgi:hypothetical protein
MVVKYYPNDSKYSLIPCINCELIKDECECGFYEPDMQRICEYCNYDKRQCDCF